MVNESPITFEDIVSELKRDLNQNIFKICAVLNCSENLVYRRITRAGYDGIRDLKDAIRNSKL